MTKREMSLERARIAGFNNDKVTFTRLIIESRVNKELLNKAWELGQYQATHGIL